jgi:hypothetical protein
MVLQQHRSSDEPPPKAYFAVRTRRLQGNRNGKIGAASGIHIENYITLSILRMKTPDLKGKRAI